jgi:WD40 repeat protein
LSTRCHVASLTPAGTFQHQKAVFAVDTATVGIELFSSSGSENGEVHVWKGTASPQEVDYLQGRIQPQAGSAFVVRFAPDGTVLLAAGEGWATVARLVGKTVQTWPLPGPIVGMALSPDNDQNKSRVAVAADKLVWVRDLVAGVTRKYGPGGADAIKALAWPAAPWLATAQGTQIALWDPDGADGSSPAAKDKVDCPVAQAMLAGTVSGNWLASVDGTSNPVVRVWLTPFNSVPSGGKTAQPVTAAAGAAAGPMTLATAGGGNTATPRDQIIELWGSDGTRQGKLSPGRKSTISALAFDLTGKKIAWADGEKNVVVAQAADMGSVLQSSTSSDVVRALALNDGWVALGYANGKLEFLKASDLSVAASSGTHTKTVNALAFSPDNTNVLYSASDDQTALRWDLSGSPPTSQPLSGLGSAKATELAVLKGGALIAVGTSAGDVLLWKKDNLSVPWATFSGHTGGVTALATTANGRYLAAAQLKDQVIHFWDLDTQLELQQFPKTHTKPVSALGIAVSADDQPARVVSAASDTDMALLAWTLAARWAFPANDPTDTTTPPAKATALGLTADGVVLVGLANNKTFALTPGNRKMIGTTNPVSALAPAKAANGSVLVFIITSNDTTIQAWNVAAGSLSVPIAQLPEVPKALAVDPAGTFVVVGFENRDARLYQIPLQGWLLLPGLTKIAALGFLPDHRVVSAPSDNGKAQLWNTLGPTQAFGTPFTLTQTPSTFAADWVPDGDGWGLILGGHDTNGGGSSLRLIDAKAQQKKQVPAPDEIRAVAVWPGDRSWLVSGGLDRNLTLWVASQLTQKTQVPLPESLQGSVVALAFYKGAVLRLLAAGFSQGQIGLWTVKADGSGIDQFMKALDAGTSAIVKAVAFSPKDGKLASLGCDGTLRVWDVSQPDNPPLVTFNLPPSGTLTYQLSWSTDGTFLVVAGSDRSAHVIQFTP